MQIVIMAEIRVLEHPTLKVPYETLNRKFRNAQKTIDKEISQFNSAAQLLETSLENGASTEEVSDILSSMVAKLKVLKRKANEGIEEENEAAKVCRKRLTHLQEYETLSANDQQIWKKKRLDRMLVEYCLRLGYYDTALELSVHSNIKELTNVDIFLQSKQIEEALLNHQTAPCLAWCHENKSKLRKSHSFLDMRLRQQEFVELVRKQKLLDAVKYAKKYFSVAEEHHLIGIQRLMGLLAFSPDTKVSPYKELFSEERWQDLVEEFRRENFNLHQVSGNSVFLVTLQCGLSALKTPQCYKDGTKNTNCPVCAKNLNELARTLPTSHCSNSKLVCSATGDILDEHNPPMALPNGHVYGLKALEQMAIKNDGTIVCPKTKQIYTLNQADKVYIM